ncbi:MAG: hypothetical protein U0744_04930 [Gemmataceae bacterium]
MALIDAARQLVDRANAAGQRGSVARPEDLDALIRKHVSYFPDWYFRLITTVPICRLQLGWKSREPSPPQYPDDIFDDGISWMIWSSVAEMQSEWDCYPWIIVTEGHYLNVAADDEHCGNPYFIPTNLGEDPPLFRVHHEIGKLKEFDEFATQVAPSLSQFFQNCIVRQD